MRSTLSMHYYVCLSALLFLDDLTDWRIVHTYTKCVFYYRSVVLCEKLIKYCLIMIIFLFSNSQSTKHTQSVYYRYYSTWITCVILFGFGFSVCVFFLFVFIPEYLIYVISVLGIVFLINVVRWPQSMYAAQHKHPNWRFEWPWICTFDFISTRIVNKCRSISFSIDQVSFVNLF